MQPDEQIAEILDIRDYSVAQYLVLATRDGLVKKTELTAYDTNRSRGVIAINLRDDDELVSAMLVGEHDDILLVSKKGMSLRFEATDAALRPMGRSTSGVKGMTFRRGDSLLEASVVSGFADDAAVLESTLTDEATGQRLSPSDTYVFVVTEGGYAKSTRVEEYRKQQRGGLGIKVAKLSDDRGDLAGALIASRSDEVLVVLASGKVVRSDVAEVPAKGRDTMGVVFAKFADDDRIIAIAKNSERNLVEEAAETEAAEPAGEE
jgi:DNA gyrase subunit A